MATVGSAHDVVADGLAMGSSVPAPSQVAYVVMRAEGNYPIYILMWNMGSNGEPEPPDTSSGSCPR